MPECTEDRDCSSRGDGKTKCDKSLSKCIEPDSPTLDCGNSHWDDGEDCDGEDLNGKSCAALDGFVDGTLACNKSCRFDTSGCAQCTESDLSLCDPDQICTNGHCVDATHTITCGDGLVEGDELCDSENLNGKSCADVSNRFHAGTLHCRQCQFNTDSCYECSEDAHCAGNPDKPSCMNHVCVPTCGNNKLDEEEFCDGSLFMDGILNCSEWSPEFNIGRLSCTSDCEIDDSACGYIALSSCGNKILDEGEDCDGNIFRNNATSCAAWNENYSSGDVSCNRCTISYKNCKYCLSFVDDEIEKYAFAYGEKLSSVIFTNGLTELGIVDERATLEIPARFAGNDAHKLISGAN